MVKKFNQVFDRSAFHVAEPVVKIEYDQKGNNIVFGRSASGASKGNLIYLGKVLENSVGKNYLSANAWLDVSFPHVIYITGTRGSGKSFDLGVLIEGIAKLHSPSEIQQSVDGIASILIDTQSQFWTLRYAPRPNVPANAEQLKDLTKWGIDPNALADCQLFVPVGTEKITGDEKEFQLAAKDVLHEEWCALIGEDAYSPQGHVLAVALEQFGNNDFDLTQLVDYLADSKHWDNMPEASRNAVAYKLDGYRRLGLFGKMGLNIAELLVPGRCSVFLLRDLRNEDKAIVSGLIARQLFTVMGSYHKKRKVASFFGKRQDGPQLPSRAWLLIDEAHVVAPSGSSSAATKSLIEFVKRGRDAGLSLVIATQQPSAVDDRILSQVNLSLSHRLSFANDISAAMHRVPTKLVRLMKISGLEVSEFGDMLRLLEAGQCFLGDFGTSRAILVQIRPRVTSHGGYNPV
jgi:hypothetical protein